MSAERREPMTIPEWHAMHREASLVSQIIGAGATALGRASYGNAFGEYYTGFFGLSIGLERLAKLILISDYVIENDGALPNQSVTKGYGHNLKRLISKADEIAKRRDIAIPYLSPSDPICAAVIECLDSFADASKGRYANFEAIGNPAFDPAEEPVAKWWTKVVEPILDKHYRRTSVENGVKSRAAAIDSMLADVATVRFIDESGNQMTDVASASERTGQTKTAQKYGRFYTLAIVRWLSHIFIQLVRDAGYRAETPTLFGHHEFFYSYMNDDSYLRDRKTWPAA